MWEPSQLGILCEQTGDPGQAMIDRMDDKVDDAGTALKMDHTRLGKTLQLPPPFHYNGQRLTCELTVYPDMYAAFWYHPDHLASSSYITNLAGEITQHMEYLPFGETLVEEHLNSNNSPYKFNAKEYDAETGNYYYGARYYDPKFSIWLSVDPLAEEYPTLSPYIYVAQNPLKYIDPDGRRIVYHSDNSFLFNVGIKARLFFQSIFGSKETRSVIKQLRISENDHVIRKISSSGSFTYPKSLEDYEAKALNDPKLKIPDYLEDSKETIATYNKNFSEHEKNRPNKHRDGSGDGSYVNLNFDADLNHKSDGDYKKTKNTILFHELFHSKRMDDGEMKSNKIEEIKASQFINGNFRNEKNRRECYGDWEIPKEN